jgi:hypothetical protein
MIVCVSQSYYGGCGASQAKAFATNYFKKLFKVVIDANIV